MSNTKKPEVNATGETIQEVVAEVIRPQQDPNAMTFGAKALLLSVANDICKRSQDNPKKVLMEEMLSYNVAWAMLEMSVDTLDEGKKAKITIPKDKEAVVKSFIDTFNDLGVTLHPLAAAEGEQLAFQFGKEDVSKDTAANLAEQKKVVNKEVKIPELNPEKWTTPEMAKNGLFYQLATAKGRIGDNIISGLEMTKIYLRSQAKTDEEKAKVNTMNYGGIMKQLVKLLGSKRVFIVRGMAACCTTSLSKYECPIFAHGTVAKNLSRLDKDQVADIVKAFVEISLEDNPKKYENGKDIQEVGFRSADRDFYLQMVKKETAEQKSCVNIFENSLTERPVSADPDYELQLVNLLIETANLYRDEKDKLKLFTKGEFPVSSAEQVAPSPKPEEETAKEEPKEESKEESKKEESKVEEPKPQTPPSGQSKKDKKKKK